MGVSCKVNKGLKLPGMSVLKEICKKTVTEIRLSTSLLQMTLLPPLKSFIRGQAVLDLVQKSLCIIYNSKICDVDGLIAVE